MYNTGLMFVKLTFLTQYSRVLATKRMHTICIVAMAIVGAWSLSQVLVGVFICHPIAGFWDQTIKAKCIPNLPQWYINAAGNIATDIAIFVLPLPVLSHLNLPKLQKIILIGIFSMGFLQVFRYVTSVCKTNGFPARVPSPSFASSIFTSSLTSHTRTSTLLAGPSPNSVPASPVRASLPSAPSLQNGSQDSPASSENQAIMGTLKVALERMAFLTLTTSRAAANVRTL
jgi:hypothetical protein